MTVATDSDVGVGMGGPLTDRWHCTRGTEMPNRLGRPARRLEEWPVPESRSRGPFGVKSGLNAARSANSMPSTSDREPTIVPTLPQEIKT